MDTQNNPTDPQNTPSTEDILKKGITNARQSGLITPFYTENRRDIGLDFEERNKYDDGLTIGMDQNMNRADNQGAFKTLTNSLVQLGTGIVGETANTLGYTAAIFTGLDTSEDVNPLASMLLNFGEEAINLGQELAPVYTNETGVFEPLNSEWWGKTITNFGPTLGMMVGSMGTGLLVKGTGSLAKQAMKGTIKRLGRAKIKTTAALKAGRLGAVEGASAQAQNLAYRKALREGIKQQATRSGLIVPDKISKGAETILVAGLSRNAESLAASEAVYEQIYNETLQMYPGNEELAKQRASAASSELYTKSMMLLAFDIFQYNAIMHALKIDGALFPKFNASYLGKTLNAFKEPLSEALEEGLQYTFEQQVLDDVYEFGGQRSVVNTFIESLADKEMQESLVQGALGGGVFAGVGRLAKYYKEKRALQEAIDPDKDLQTTTDVKDADDGAEDSPIGEVPDTGVVDDGVDAPDITNAPSEDPNVPDVGVMDEAFSNAMNAAGEQSAPVPDMGPGPEEFSDGSPLPQEPPIPYAEDSDFDPYKAGEGNIPYEPNYESQDGISPDMDAAAEALTNPETREDLDGAIPDGLGNSKKENVAILVNDASRTFPERKGAMRKQLKDSHGSLGELAEAVIMKNAIRRNPRLSKEQKKSYVKPYLDIINKYKEKGQSMKATDVDDYSNLSNFANDLINNKLDNVNKQNVQEVKEPSYADLSDQRLAEVAKRQDLTPEAKQQVLQEIDNRKVTPELTKARNVLVNEELSPETMESLGITDTTDLVEKTLAEIVRRNLGGDITVVIEGTEQKYDVETNTLTIPKNASVTTASKILTITQALAENDSDLVTHLSELFNDNGIHIPADRLIHRILFDEELGNQLRNIVYEQDDNNITLADYAVDVISGAVDLDFSGDMNNTVRSVLYQQMLKSGKVEKASEKEEPDVNFVSTNSVHNLVSPYRMVTYNAETNTVKHNRRNYPVIKNKNTGVASIKVGEETYYLQPGYDNVSSGTKVTVLLDSNDQAVISDTLYSKKDTLDMNQNIPVGAALDIVVDEDYNDKVDTFKVKLMYNGKLAGYLSGNFNDNYNQELHNLRKLIRKNHLNNQAQPKLELKKSNQHIIRSNEGYVWTKVLPTGQKPRFALVTHANEEIAEELGINVEDTILQYGPFEYHLYTGNQPKGSVIMFIESEATGVSVPIPGDRVMFKDNSRAKRELLDVIDNTSEDKLEEAIRSQVRWTVYNDAGYPETYPKVDKNWRRRNMLKQDQLTDFIKEGDPVMRNVLDFGTDKIKMFNDYMAGKGKWEDVKDMFVSYKEGMVYQYSHPFTGFYYSNRVYSRAPQLDRNKINNIEYMTDRQSYFGFQVSPKTVFSIPERVVSLTPIEQQTPVVEQAQIPAVPDTPQNVSSPQNIDEQQNAPVNKDAFAGLTKGKPKTQSQKRRAKRNGDLDNLNDCTVPPVS